MAGRVLFVENRCKLSFSNNYLLVDGIEGSGKYYLDDIEAIVFSSLAVSVSAYLLNELAAKGTTVVFAMPGSSRAADYYRCTGCRAPTLK